MNWKKLQDNRSCHPGTTVFHTWLYSIFFPFYSLLGVDKTASQEEIRSKFRELAKKLSQLKPAPPPAPASPNVVEPVASYCCLFWGSENCYLFIFILNSELTFFIFI